MKLIANDFSTTFPETWQDRTMYTLVGPFKPGEFAANCVITQHFVDATESIEDFANEQTAIMRESLPTFELLDFRAATIAGFPACQQLHRFNADGRDIQQVQTFVLANRKIYVITGTAPVGEFERHIAAFREVVENLEFGSTN